MEEEGEDCRSGTIVKVFGGGFGGTCSPEERFPQEEQENTGRGGREEIDDDDDDDDDEDDWGRAGVRPQ